VEPTQTTDDPRRKPVVKVSGIELDYLAEVVAALPHDDSIVSSGDDGIDG